MREQLHICHVITRMIVGGAQENTLLTVRGLMEKGHDVVLLTGPSPGPEGALLEECRDMPALQVTECPALQREISPVSDLRAFLALWRHFRDHTYDVVHTHSSKAGILGRLAARLAGVPLIVHTVHGQAFHRYQSWGKNQFFITAERIAALTSHRIFAVAQAMVDQCVEAKVAPREKYSVVYSGMDIDGFLNATPDTELRRQLGILDDAIVIGKIARLFKLKGHRFLLQAASQILQECPNVVFLLVGNGNLRDELEEKIQKEDMEDHFVFTGLIPPEEIPRYVGIMDVLVHLSLREGLPRTVVQALAAGIPAVGFNLDGTPEVILNGKTGFLCEPENVSQVTEALLELIQNPRLRRRMGENGRELTGERFAWKRMVDTLEKHYFECLHPDKTKQ